MCGLRLGRTHRVYIETPPRLGVAVVNDLDSLALLVVDVHRGFDDGGYWGPRNNRACEENIRRLLADWRGHGRPVVFVRHDSTEPGSPLRPGQPGNEFKPVVAGEPDLLITKSVNSAFHGAPRGGDLRDNDQPLP